MDFWNNHFINCTGTNTFAKINKSKLEQQWEAVYRKLNSRFIHCYLFGFSLTWDPIWWEHVIYLTTNGKMKNCINILKEEG